MSSTSPHDKTNGGATSAAATGTTADRTPANVKPVAQERTAAVTERKSRQRRHKRSKTQRGASVASSTMKQATAQDTQAEDDERKAQESQVPREAASKGTATADVPRKQGGSKPALSAVSKNVKGTASARSLASAQYPASSPRGLASSTHSPDKGNKGRESLHAMNALLDARADARSPPELSPATIVTAKYKLPYDVKVMLASLVIMVILGFAFFLLPKPKEQRGQMLCMTKGCDQHRRRIETQLDKSVDPCDDFGAYVCKRWKPHRESLLCRSQMSDMVMEWLYKLPDTLKKSLHHFPVGNKVAAMYNSCMTQEESEVPIMKEFMEARGILWPEKLPEEDPPAMALFDLSFNWNVNLWFTLNVLPAVPGKVQRRIFLSTNDKLLLWKNTMKGIPKKYFHSVYTGLFKMFANDTRSLPDADDMSKTIGTLEYVLDALVPSCPCKTRMPALLRLGDIDNGTAIPVALHMRDMFNAVLGIEPPVTLDDLVLVTDVSQFNTIMNIISQVNDTELLRHLSYLFAQTYSAVAYPGAFLLVVHGSETHAKEERPRFCADRTEPGFKLLVTTMASVAHFSDTERRDILGYLEGIVEVAVNKIAANSWLDDRIKNRSVEKLNNVQTFVWPSDKFFAQSELGEVYKNFPDSARSFTEFWLETRRSQRRLFGSEAAAQELLLGHNTHLPYMDYVQVLNRLSVSLGVLAPPLYYRDGTKAMLYGGVLYHYARALISAIDDVGVMINSQGEIASSWVNDKGYDSFKQRILGCLPGNTSIFPEIPAMEVAYEAFRQHIEDNDTRLSEDLTEEKVFFITACLSSCAKTPGDNLYGGDCNKAVMNFAPFATAFGCPPRSKMNPATKCSFFN